MTVASDIAAIADAGDNPPSRVRTALTSVNAAAAQRTGGGVETLNTIASSTADSSIDLADGNVVDMTLDDSPTLTFTGATASTGCSFTLILRQDATGSRTVTWPASVDWPSATAPTLSTGANDVDVITFVSVDGGTTWLGFTAGLNLS